MCLPPWLVPTKSASFSPLNDVWREGGLRACNIATLLLRQWIHGAVSSPESQFIRYKTRCSDCRACKSRNYWRGLAFSAASRLLFFVRFSLDKFYMILRACSGRMREDGNDGNKKKKKGGGRYTYSYSRGGWALSAWLTSFPMFIFSC